MHAYIYACVHARMHAHIYKIVFFCRQIFHALNMNKKRPVHVVMWLSCVCVCFRMGHKGIPRSSEVERQTGNDVMSSV